MLANNSTNKITSEQSKVIMVEILNNFKEICEKYKLKYFLAYGTLLGAVRHKGFIPWDDDIDICMLRCDYEFLINTDEFKYGYNNYKFMTTLKNSSCVFPFIKMIDDRTITVGLEKNSQGIYIDIFPIDKVPAKNSPMHNFFWKSIKKCCKYQLFAAEKQFTSRNKGLLRDIIKYVRWKTFNIIGYVFFTKCWEYIATRYNNVDTGFYGMVMWPEVHECYVLREELLCDFTEVQFENNTYKAPSGYVEYLTIMYGANYMQLPPIEQRSSHGLEAYWK